MPNTPLKNLVYRAALPWKAPSVKDRLTHIATGETIDLSTYDALLCKHHVHGASLLLKSGNHQAQVLSSLNDGIHIAAEDTYFRVASLTKMATSLVTLRMIENNVFSLDTPIIQLLPAHLPNLEGISVRMLLSHTSSLRDLPETDALLSAHETLDRVLSVPGIRQGNIGTFSYCNFGFGLLGCILENISGKSLRNVFDELLFAPASMRATIDASTLPESSIMPCTRVLPYHPDHSIRRTKLGSIPLDLPDPKRHFGHTAGALYTNADSISAMLSIIQTGRIGNETYLSPALLHEMHSVHATYGKRSPTLSYGLGLLFIDDPSISPSRLIGHQGFAYGVVDGAFFEADSGKQCILLNGGCSEARTGMLGISNRDILRFGLEEMKKWHA